MCMRRRADEQLLSHIRMKRAVLRFTILLRTSTVAVKVLHILAFYGAWRTPRTSYDSLALCSARSSSSALSSSKDERKRSVYTENMALSVERKEPDNSNRENFFFQTKRWRWRTAELKNKFTPDYIHIYICSSTFRSHQALLCLVVS